MKTLALLPAFGSLGQTPALNPTQGDSSGYILPLVLGLLIGAAVAVGVILLLGRQRMTRARSRADPTHSRR